MRERAKGQKKSQRMKICINLMRFQEASGIFINSSAKDTQNSFSFNLRLLFHLLLSTVFLLSGGKQQRREGERASETGESMGRRNAEE